MSRFLALASALLLISAAGGAETAAAASCGLEKSTPLRPHSVSIAEFGAVGDGLTLNTKAFQNAIFYLRSFADKGGAQLFVPPGRWLTGSFTLVSHLTLFLDLDSVILGSTDPGDWPIVDSLPRGRHQSLIFGSNLTDVVITGGNGTVDGQGGGWWARSENVTRPHLVELVQSTGVVISNLTFRNAPYAAIRPAGCSRVVVRDITVFAPPDSTNTHGIVSDSSSDVCIEDCFISTGDDLIVVKSGWDDNGGAARPSFNITIRQITGSGGGIAIGGDISGGISDVRAETLRLSDAKVGLAVRAPAGGYVRNAIFSGVSMVKVETAFVIVSGAGEIPPAVKSITIRDVVGEKIGRAGIVEGVEGGSFTDICFAGVELGGTEVPPWRCSYCNGYSDGVTPEPCAALRHPIPANCSAVCYWVDCRRKTPPLPRKVIGAVANYRPFQG